MTFKCFVCNHVNSNGNFIPTTFLTPPFLLDDLHLWDVLNFVGKWIFLSLSVGERSIHIRLFVFISLTHPTVQASGREGGGPKSQKLDNLIFTQLLGVQTRLLGPILMPLLSIFKQLGVSVLLDFFGSYLGALLLSQFVGCVCVCASSWNAVRSWVFLHTSYRPVSAPGTSLFFILAFSWNS